MHDSSHEESCSHVAHNPLGVGVTGLVTLRKLLPHKLALAPTVALQGMANIWRANFCSEQAPLIQLGFSVLLAAAQDGLLLAVLHAHSALQPLRATACLPGDGLPERTRYQKELERRHRSVVPLAYLSSL